MISFNLPNPLTEQNSISYHRQRGCLETANPPTQQALSSVVNPAPASAHHRGGWRGCEEARRSPSPAPAAPGQPPTSNLHRAGVKFEGFESLLGFQAICLSPDLIRNLNTVLTDTLKIRVQLRLPSRIDLTQNFLLAGNPRRALLPLDFFS